jgi:hypothetical protein
VVRYTPLGNGRVLVAFDANHWIVDFYYSRAARDNHAVGQPFMFGISVDGTFRWLDRSALRETDYEGDTMISRAVYAPRGWASRSRPGTSWTSWRTCTRGS